MTAWGTTHRPDDVDRLGTAIIVGVLALLLAIGVVDRAAEDVLNRPHTVTGTVIADDPDSAAVTTSLPGDDR